MNKTYKILIIEDSHDDYELYERIIKKTLPCQITHLTSAEKALPILHELNNYHLILVDYHLPGIDGINFLKLITQENSLDASIIVLTGQGNEKIAADFMRLGITDYLPKYQASHEILSKTVLKALAKYHKKKMEQARQKELLFFAHTLAHDLKSPIGRIHTYCKLLNNNPDRHQIYTANIQDDAQFLMTFIDSLLVYAEHGRNRFEKKNVDLKAVLDQSINNLELDIKKSNATIKGLNKLPVIYGAEIALIQLFQNLLSNSIKYCAREPIIEIHSHSERDKTIIDVLDNGIGIPEEHKKAIFEPFQRAHHSIDAQGVGLGLALVKMIVEQHQGEIDVKPRKNGGSQFSIVFPK